ncbi:hypothetical protein C8J56DRAFT_1067893 [Mycena floridula]|nr:hypothetical protein C8J56DRAFT_1067893 [Mycena floridula]
MLQKSNKILQQSLISLSAHPEKSTKFKNPETFHPLSKTALLPLNPEDYENTKFWDQYKFQIHVESRTNENQSVSKTDFLVDEDGEICAKTRRGLFRSYAYSAFSELQENDQAPMTWKKHSDTACNYFACQMESNFIEFQFCRNHWKTDPYVTIVFPDWCTTRTKPAIQIQTKKDDSLKHLQPDLDEDTTTFPVTPSSSTSSLPAVTPRPASSSPIPEQSMLPLALPQTMASSPIPEQSLLPSSLAPDNGFFLRFFFIGLFIRFSLISFNQSIHCNLLLSRQFPISRNSTSESAQAQKAAASSATPRNLYLIHYLKMKPDTTAGLRPV